jgi:hypothetical protein
MMTHRTTPFIAAFAGLIALLFTLPASPKSAVKQQLQDLEEDQALEALLEPSAGDNAMMRALTNLTVDLAQAGLVPRVDFSGGHFDASGKEGGASFSAPLVFSRQPAFARRIRLVAKALGASATAPRTICFSTPDGATERFNVSKTGEAILLEALSVSGIDPVPMHHAQMNGRVVVLSGARVGESLYGALRKLTEGGRAEVSLSLAPLPQWQPVRLSLTTTDGQRVTIPVELDGADRKLQVTSDTRWVVDGVETNIAFDKVRLGQIVLLAEMMRHGNLKLTGLTISDHYPVSRTVRGALLYTFHLLGANGAWFASIDHLIQPKMTVRHTAGACSLAVDFASHTAAVVDLGWQPMSVWNELSSAKPVAAGQTEMVVGYLTPPKCASDDGGVSAKKFEMLMKLPRICAALCKSAAHAAQGIPAIYGSEGVTWSTAQGIPFIDGSEAVIISPALSAQRFSAGTCQTTCMEMSEYRKCLKQKVKGDKRARYKGLAHCEGRRKATK